ncbi:MAG: molybdenum cofactor biosynthesis protein MoaE [Marinicaulis sp.]|nr:molybdenum cofactor biosynthesis protein MoaE [Marinicaulis sp.]NNE40925.1 molybdenum cofactor biosynthesis protein MoaE [Marinicaulis sp.]NNL89208.1 molybdenum cofactor biosynthesis protein MoaE [Marinicaulis sp.]
MIRVSEKPFEPGAELSAFENQTADEGAIVSFLGKVRPKGAGGDLIALKLEHYSGVTERSIADIVAKAEERWSISNSLIIHRVGAIDPGEPIVLVCVAAKHRRDAFKAADFLMDYLKTEAYFWKKEITSAGEEWIEPRKGDYDDVKRWQTSKLS